MSKNDALPVYLFTGFLEAGKTKFIQETLEDSRFNRGERTLLLLCEEGVEEYEPADFAGKNVSIRVIGDEAAFTTEALAAMDAELRPERVMLEYNGMWMLDTLYNAMPERWVVAQEFLFAEAGSFLLYNANLRSLVVDKLRSAELVVLNRYADVLDRMAIHKVIRGVSRGCDIAYEYPDGHVEYDDIEDPLPFDLEAPVVEIADRDFAIWYRDMAEDPDRYDGKTVRFRAHCVVQKKFPKGTFVVGRRIMTCCIEDTEFAGLICRGAEPDAVRDGDWILLTAKLQNRYHKAYGRRGPVLTALSLEHCDAPEQPVATFT